MAFQPVGNLCVENAVELDIVFAQNAPGSMVRTKLDITLTQSVFIAVIVGKVQTKGWKRMRQMERHFRRLALRRELSALAGGGLDAVFFAFGFC